MEDISQREWTQWSTCLMRSVGVIGSLREEHWTHLMEHPCIGALLVYDITLELDMYTLRVKNSTCMSLLVDFYIACKGLGPHIFCLPLLPLIYIEEGESAFIILILVHYLVLEM
jgi:hypothetical protein